MKKCLKCLQTKDFNQYGHDRKRPDRLKLWCLGCCEAFTKIRYENLMKSKQRSQNLFTKVSTQAYRSAPRPAAEFFGGGRAAASAAATAEPMASFGDFLQLEDQLIEMNQHIDAKLKECMWLRSKRLTLMQRLGMIK